MIATIVREVIRSFALFLTGAKAYWEQDPEIECSQNQKCDTQNPSNQRGKIYYANHNSHGDFVLLWACLPRILRKQVRPVAGEDYWGKTKLRRFIILKVFNGVLIARNTARNIQQVEDTQPDDPHNCLDHSQSCTLQTQLLQAKSLQPMLDALDAGDSIIIFPEGTRNLTEDLLLPFKSGLYHLSQARPDAELVPVWLANLGRIFPKGSWLPLPLLCTVHFGESLKTNPLDQKIIFLNQARNALLKIHTQQAPFKHDELNKDKKNDKDK